MHLCRKCTQHLFFQHICSCGRCFNAATLWKRFIDQKKCPGNSGTFFRHHRAEFLHPHAASVLSRLLSLNLGFPILPTKVVSSLNRMKLSYSFDLGYGHKSIKFQLNCSAIVSDTSFEDKLKSKRWGLFPTCFQSSTLLSHPTFVFANLRAIKAEDHKREGEFE